MKQWKVRRPSGKTFIVEANYFTLDHGHLCFRKSSGGPYPDTVYVVAPRYWTEVEAA